MNNNKFLNCRRRGTVPLRPYNHKNQWYVSREYFEKNYTLDIEQCKT